MLTPNALYSLSAVRYHEANAEIVATFSNAFGVKSQRYRFFPALLVNASSPEFFSVLSLRESRQVQVVETKKSTLKVIGATFSLLRAIQDRLKAKNKGLSLLLFPERQFLLEQNWGFFDLFSFSQEPEKVSGISLPRGSLGFLPDSFEQTLSDLLEHNETEAAASLCASIARSNVLKLPLSGIPLAESQQNQALLENQFFLAGVLCADSLLLIPTNPVLGQLPLAVFENTAEFDFSASSSLLCTRSYYNLGLETLDCSCCRPAHAASSNLLPNSRVKIRIVSNGFFFDSLFSDFACSFHESFPKKDCRERRQKEFGLSLVPIGPFFEGQVIEAPLADAEQLERNSHGVIMGLGSDFHWFCVQKESALSKTLADFSNQIRLLEKRTEDLGAKALSKDKMQGLFFLEKNPYFFFQRVVSGRLNRLFESLPSLFLSPSAEPRGFFSREFAFLLLVLRNYGLKRFVEFSQSNGFRAFCSPRSNKAFIQKTAGFGLARAFAQSEKMPLPEVVDWHFWTESGKPNP